MSDFQRLAQIAEEAARAAGELLRKAATERLKVNSAAGKDIKLQVDEDSEHLIREMLASATNYPVIGEEHGGDAKLTERYEPYWVVDPLDGTHNYLRGAPLCCVSIGLMRGETPLLGVIYDFNRDDCFTGIVADGMYVNGERRQPIWSEDRSQAVLQTGFPTGRSYDEQALAEFINSVKSFKKVRLIGSAALALAWVAAGRYDVYFEEGINLWDVAAGLALVQAAGGVIRMTAREDRALSYNIWAAGHSGLIG